MAHGTQGAPRKRAYTNRRGLGRVPTGQDELFRLLAASAHLVAKGKMTAQEGKAVADLANRASQVLRKMGGQNPTLTSDELRGKSLEELAALFQGLVGQLQPSQERINAVQGQEGQGRQEAVAIEGAGPGVAKVLELLQREEPAA